MRVVAIGIYDTFQSGAKAKLSAVAIRTPYLRVVGLELDTSAVPGMPSCTPEEEEQLMELSRQPQLYEKIVQSIAPSISGDYTVDIKRAIACLLFGGSHKVLPDGMKLRGDMHLLLLGDPSVGKSQFLKFVEKVAPIGVYTSGKGSSAAGLTASVIKDSRGEYFLEGGAMVLADGGVVCIDEFDKMREQDRVAIHEAMEQQTISVAKAGIHTVLNSRCSVVSSANPVFGRYDDDRSAAENIDFLPTILSRFDLIFIVRDVRDVTRDKAIARHVVNVCFFLIVFLSLSLPPSLSCVLLLLLLLLFCRYSLTHLLTHSLTHSHTHRLTHLPRFISPQQAHLKTRKVRFL